MTRMHLSSAEYSPPIVAIVITSSSYTPPSSQPSFIIIIMIPFTVQPTNFQHVQICPLCNHADDLATSGRRLHQSLGAEWSGVFFLFRLINVKNQNKRLTASHPFL